MNEIEVSVAVSCYNFENYIEECLNSIISQKTNFKFEVIVVDDCSTDNSAVLIERLIAKSKGFQNLKLIKQPSNRGSDATKQLACKLAKGKFIAFLDGDDLAYPGKLQLQYDYLNANPDCSCCYHDVELIDKSSSSLGYSYFEQFYNQQYVPEKANMGHLVQYGTFLAASSQMFIASAFKEHLLPVSVKYIQDFFYHIHTASYGSFGRINQILGAYRQHSESYTGQNSKSTQRRLDCLQDILQACDYAKEVGCSESIVERGKSHFYFATAVYFAKKNQRPLFKELIEKSSDGALFFDARHKNLYEKSQESLDLAIKYINSKEFQPN